MKVALARIDIEGDRWFATVITWDGADGATYEVESVGAYCEYSRIRYDAATDFAAIVTADSIPANVG